MIPTTKHESSPTVPPASPVTSAIPRASKRLTEPEKNSAFGLSLFVDDTFSQEVVGRALETLKRQPLDKDDPPITILRTVSVQELNPASLATITAVRDTWIEKHLPRVQRLCNSTLKYTAFFCAKTVPLLRPYVWTRGFLQGQREAIIVFIPLQKWDGFCGELVPGDYAAVSSLRRITFPVQEGNNLLMIIEFGREAVTADSR